MRPYLLDKQEVDHKGNGCNPHERLDVLCLAGREVDEDIGDEAEADAVGDRVRHRDAGDDEECREGIRDLRPVDVDDVAHHEVADDHEGAAGCSGAHDGDDRCEEGSDDEEDASEDRGQAGAATISCARGRLDECRDGGSAAEAAHSSSCGVDDQNLLDVLDRAIVVQEVALLGDCHGSAHRVEEVGHHEREGIDKKDRRRYDLRDAHGTIGIGLERSAEAREVESGNDAVRSSRDAQRNASDDSDDDADEKGARHLHRIKDDRGDDGDEADDEGRARHLAEAHHRGLTGDDDAAVLEADHCDEEAKADGDGMAKRHRDCIHDSLAQATENEDEDRDALDEDDCHGGMPVSAIKSGERKGNNCVDAHAGSAGKRAVCEDAHEDRHDAGADARCRDSSIGRHACDDHERGVDGDDVGHRQERCKAGTCFLADRRSTLLELEELLHP